MRLTYQTLIILILGATMEVGYPSSSSLTRLQVPVLDTGLNLDDPRFADILCPAGHKDFTGEGISDTHGHGTHIAGILKDAAFDHTKYCLVIVKVFKGAKDNDLNWYLQGLAYVANQKYGLANLSLTGGVKSEDEKNLILASGTIYVVAAGNEGTSYKEHYPGGYGLPNVRVVGNWDCIHQKKNVNSNYGEEVIWRCGTNILSTLPNGKRGYMTGSSMATPLYTAELINKMTNGRK